MIKRTNALTEPEIIREAVAASQYNTYAGLTLYALFERIITEGSRRGWPRFDEFKSEMKAQSWPKDAWIVDFIERLYADKGFKQTLDENALLVLAKTQEFYRTNP